MLRGLPQVEDGRLIVGHATFDDAGVVYLSPETALVQTVDFFPPVVDDAFVFGQVAAANSLSDVYAMGGTPLTAMGIVCFPLGDLPHENLTEILRGGADRIKAAGAMLVGGHSVKDPEIKFGLSVTGTVHPQRVTSNARARPGDKLFLTKPLGMGPITTAYRKKDIAADHMKRATDVMCALNRGAAEAMSAVGINEDAGVHAATDVTGYGLLGHARNVADASRATLTFYADKVPYFEGARAYAGRKVNSGALKQNEGLLQGLVEIAPGVKEDQRRVIYDAETSGGLLIAVAPQAAARLAAELAKRGAGADEVGLVEARGSHMLRLR
ncbi:MAG: selenide, water dikinase SelD [Planctomycetota bacterium]|nr:selenide, water dikinase SelD [Planctomycetota bacterium]